MDHKLAIFTFLQRLQIPVRASEDLSDSFSCVLGTPNFQKSPGLCPLTPRCSPTQRSAHFALYSKILGTALYAVWGTKTHLFFKKSGGYTYFSAFVIIIIRYVLQYSYETKHFLCKIPKSFYLNHVVFGGSIKN
jgi:hypothetical protein